jgi:LPS export ABC transporter protein LptC
MIYRLTAIVALVVLIIVVVVISAPQREIAAPTPAGAPAHDPGYSARDAYLVQTGRDGRPIYSLDATEIQQLPDQGTIDLAQVRLVVRDADGNVWNARGDRGQLGQNSGVVQLSGAVRLSGLVPGSSDAAELLSEQLSFDTNSQIATTAEAVTLLMSGRELQAFGLMANLKNGQVQLESDVHGSFTH